MEKLDFIPTRISEITSNELREKLQVFCNKLNEEPPADVIISERGSDGKYYKYLPISYLEKELDKFFFGLKSWEITDVKIIVNEIVVVGTLRLLHPILGIWLSYSGIGAEQIKQHSGSKVSDFLDTKKVSALGMDAPNANIEAFKNACKRIGKRFGQDLNRNHQHNYNPFSIKKLNE